MRRILITVYFDIDHDKPTEDRDYDRFILEVIPGKLMEKLLEVVEAKNYSWDDFDKMRNGYKGIMGFDTINLTDIEVYK